LFVRSAQDTDSGKDAENNYHHNETDKSLAR